MYTGDDMEPIYKGFKDLYDFFTSYGEDASKPDEFAAKEALAWSHNHVCWLNPTGNLFSKKTQKMCRKFCKKNKIPKERYYDEYYDCDYCPNLITYYKKDNDILFALGNSYLYQKEGKLDK